MSWRWPATRSSWSMTARSAVSLPEVPLLGVLPGTGGLTRLTDKRHVRHDLADVFCTTSEGVRGQRAMDWRLVDEIARPARVRRRGAGTRARAGGQERPPGRCKRRPADADRNARSSPMNCAIRTVNVDDRPGAALRGVYRQWPDRRTAQRHRRHRGGRRAPGIPWRWPANWTTPSSRCAPTNSTSAPG